MSIIEKHNHIYYKNDNKELEEKINILGYNPDINIFKKNVIDLENKEKNKFEKIILLFKNNIQREDYEKLLEVYMKNYNKIFNSDIPKGLLFESNDLFKLMLKQYQKVKSKYQIELVDNDIFNFRIVKDNISLMFKYHYQLTPYYPPEVKILKPSYDNIFLTRFYNWKILEPKKWNPSITPIQLIDTIFDIIEKYGKLSDSSDSEIIFLLINLAKTEKLSFDYLEFEDNLLTLNGSFTPTDKTKYWASGTGYGHGNQSDFDINKYLEHQKNTQDKLIDITNQIINHINSKKNDFDYNNSCLLNYIKSRLFKTSILDWEKNIKLYQTIINLTKIIIDKDLFNQQNKKELYNILISNDNEFTNYISLNNDNDEYSFMIKSIYSIINIIKPKEEIKKISEDVKEIYLNQLKNHQFDTIDLIENKYPYYYCSSLNSNKMTNPKSLKRIMKEVSTLSNSLPINWESSVYIRIDPKNIQCLQFLIIAPDKTPYMNGCFLFDVFFPSDYPNKPPLVNLQTTGNGTVRFNPNLYNCGKVCLSLLGTWSGQKSESWNSETSTLLQVIISIQSLIFIEQPYFNEPGYEKNINTPEGNKRSNEYNLKRMKETMRWAMLEMIKNPPKGFEEVIKIHFQYKKEEILKQLDEWNKLYQNDEYYSKYYQELKSII